MKAKYSFKYSVVMVILKFNVPFPLRQGREIMILFVPARFVVPEFAN